MIADVPLIPGHRVEPHLIRVDQGPVRRPASSSSSSSSSDSRSGSDDDDDSGHGQAVLDGDIGTPANDDNGESGEDSDNSVRIVYDSRIRRGEGPGAALLNLVSFLDAVQGVQLPPNFDANFEVLLWTHLSAPSSQ